MGKIEEKNPCVMKDSRLCEAASARFFFKRQQWHLLSLLVLLPVAWAFAADGLQRGAFLGIAGKTWFWLAVGLVVLQQVAVWLVWRGQLGWALFTRLFGRWDIAIWGLLFMPLLIARPFLVFALAMSDPGSLPLPRPVELGLGLILSAPALYTLWSVVRYFGIARALGGDHFRSQYREMPLVREGAFRFSRNAMYAFAFLGLWSIALLLGSKAALGLALFQHAYVWVHYYCTEMPDMELIYGS